MAQYRQPGADRLAVRIQNDAADRIPHRPARIRRAGKGHRRPSSAALAAALALVLLISLAASGRLSSPHKGFRRDLGEDDGGKDDPEFRPQMNNSKGLKFGHGSGKIGRDSRYWDGDDRRRDVDYSGEGLPEEKYRVGKDRLSGSWRSGKEQIPMGHRSDKVDEKGSRKAKGGLYNEGGRAELDSYKEEYEATAKDDYDLKQDNGVGEDNFDDEYDDGIDAEDKHDEFHGHDEVRMLGEGDDGGETKKDALLGIHEEGSGETQYGAGGLNSTKDQDHVGGDTTKHSGPEKKGSKRKPKHHKFSSSSCEIKLLSSTAQIVEPLNGNKFARFSLQYTHVESRPNRSENWEPRFAGHQTLEEREKSFYAHDQTINCGFIKGPSGSPSTGFDFAEDDARFMSSCHIAVSSCIFGNSDRLRSPFSKTITRLSRKNVCFVMFMDEITLRTLLSEGQKVESGFIGLWRVVVVSNLPYTDMRRVGKIPKLLAHRLFPSARYSIWLDSKLRLQSDPYLILEYFLWRRGYEYAISNHYDRHCVWEEVMQNKKLNKYNHTAIDQQFEFYQSDGLKRFNPSDPKKLLPSYVPEGSFIVRAHTPMSNLYSCLWFNEVDRFTSRDQLSFAYTYLKLRRMNPDKPFHLNMFKDCERRFMVKLFRHRAEEKRKVPTD
ncbi:hypothetical protein Cni_G22995 [Canna indica]|uniref:TOD1/MUCI70 glycosyltransferase-like domain-containing protein n=1 Tax=Canna indica TaxID=4628 RepID=A0AAQ3KT80_9LILI|nr:hypothetical protein Cni_G22995 [Canna indica]